MRFTMARPEVSCHPETLLPDARTVVSAALCYWAPEPERPPGHGRLPRYTWFDAYAELREKLDELGRRLGGAYRVLVDANQHVDREAAARSGVGFYGKNTLLITRRHGSWVVLGTLVTDVELEPTPPLDAGCGSCRLCIDACPTGALDEPGTLDSDPLPLLLDAGAAPPRPSPTASTSGRRSTAATSARTCARGTAAWRSAGRARRRPRAPSRTSRSSTGSRADPDELRRRYGRLYVPRHDGRRLLLNALVAAGNVGGEEEGAAAAAYLEVEDWELREHAAWAVGRIEERRA